MKILNIRSGSLPTQDVEEVVRVLKEGAVVGLPTESGYGLAVRAECSHLPDFSTPGLLDSSTFQGSERERFSGTLLLKNKRALYDYWSEPTPCVERLIEAFWPGPLTLILDPSLLSPAKKEEGKKIFPQGDVHSQAVQLSKQEALQNLLPQIPFPVFFFPLFLLDRETPVTQIRQMDPFLKEKIPLWIDAGEMEYPRGPTRVRVEAEGLWTLEREGAISGALLREKGYRMILFICTGNTCRSPMAEALAWFLLAQKYEVRPQEVEKEVGVKVASAGVDAEEGLNCHPYTQEIVAELCGSPLLTDFVTRFIHRDVVQEADLIYVMTRGHYEAVLSLYPWATSRLRMLDPSGKDIDDPLVGDRLVYRACAEKIKTWVEHIVEKL